LRRGGPGGGRHHERGPARRLAALPAAVLVRRHRGLERRDRDRLPPPGRGGGGGEGGGQADRRALGGLERPRPHVGALAARGRPPPLKAMTSTDRMIVGPAVTHSANGAASSREVRARESGKTAPLTSPSRRCHRPHLVSGAGANKTTTRRTACGL